MSDIDKLGPWKKVDIKSGYKDRGFMISSPRIPPASCWWMNCALDKVFLSHVVFTENYAYCKI